VPPGRMPPNKSKPPPCRKQRDKGGAPFFSALRWVREIIVTGTAVEYSGWLGV
jgi:hypothetical protein